MQYISKSLYIEDNDLVISLREREVKSIRQHFPVERYNQGTIKRNLYEEEEQDRHAFDDQGADKSKRYIIYLSSDKQRTSVKRIAPYYHEIDDWDVPIRCKNNAKRLLQKLESITNHGFYAELQSNNTMACYINIGKGIILNVDKQLYSSDLNVVYSIMYKNKILRVNSDLVDTLTNYIIQLQKKLKFIV